MNIIRKFPLVLRQKFSPIAEDRPISCWSIYTPSKNRYYFFRYQTTKSRDEDMATVKWPMVITGGDKFSENATFLRLYPKTIMAGFVLLCAVYLSFDNDKMKRVHRYRKDEWEEKFLEEYRKGYQKGSTDERNFITQGKVDRKDLKKYSGIIGYLEKKKKEKMLDQEMEKEANLIIDLSNGRISEVEKGQN